MPKRGGQKHAKTNKGHRTNLPQKQDEDLSLPETKIENVEETQLETASEPSKYRKRAIFDNWARYEIDTISDELETSEDTHLESNFEFLRENSSYCSNYFQFPSEKEWEKTKEATQNNEFNVDLKRLSEGLSCIPFYDVIQIDKSDLTENDIEKCNREAELACIKYKSLFQAKVDKPNESINLAPSGERQVDNLGVESSLKSADKNVSETGACSPEKYATSENTSSSLILESSTHKRLNKPEVTTKTENLEDWLDSVLDD